MEISKRARMEYDELPLDLSIKKSPSDENKKEEPELSHTNALNDSHIFAVPRVPPQTISISDRILASECALSQKLRHINFNFPVEYVYNPIEYAFQVHAMYVTKYCRSTKKVLFLGMNPGPWGMSQTGVPFGEVNIVRDWLKLSGNIGKPYREQADRLITGFNCTRSEISGRRFWNLFRELCSEDPEKFFRHAFLHNYCPIALMDAGGRNITPAELKGPEQYTLYAACDETLITVLKLLKVDIVVGVGRFAEKRAQTVIKTTGLPIKVLCIPHPSPRSVGNENWNEKAKLKLREYNLMQYFLY
ncbi:single-strand selective monofunctional uracil DNA glycosylase [Phymastichus coffea]|uniref:single-strand selective monofunctional uracil DNA glycosylase n=1 Tax=Phymastichus coffea TaxID=108790 RepID=UPI00273C7BDF|nr:single-strand selective monofunctional uracil DNA glycosylase [Phymastichus coffea]XP_058799668.1 single-strand selective monofunctional uracil DNA glycosylase [Phymastichus coffea]